MLIGVAQVMNENDSHDKYASKFRVEKSVRCQTEQQLHRGSQPKESVRSKLTRRSSEDKSVALWLIMTSTCVKRQVKNKPAGNSMKTTAPMTSACGGCAERAGWIGNHVSNHPPSLQTQRPNSTCESHSLRRRRNFGRGQRQTGWNRG